MLTLAQIKLDPPTRYSPYPDGDESAEMEQDPSGDYIDYDEYKALLGMINEPEEILDASLLIPEIALLVKEVQDLLDSMPMPKVLIDVSKLKAAMKGIGK